jgi:hypothetical protein
LNELHLALAVGAAEQLKDFVIPLWIDDIQPIDWRIQLGPRTAIKFQEGWAKGTAQLIEKLEQDSIPKNTNFNPDAVNGWWRHHIGAQGAIKDVPERLVSNWYPISSARLYFHELAKKNIGAIQLPGSLPYPAIKHNQYLVAFAPAEDFETSLGADLTIVKTVDYSVDDVESQARIWTASERRSAISNLLRQVWESFIRSKSLPHYEFASGGQAYWVKRESEASERFYFTTFDGGRSWRNLTGVKTYKGRDGDPDRFRYWHFALEPRPVSDPFIGYVMKPHVLFSSDGKTIWDSPDRLHAARRSQCKQWWNDKWRDMIAAAVENLADESGEIRFSTGTSGNLTLQSPIVVLSPVSYDEAELAGETISTDGIVDDLDDQDTEDDLSGDEDQELAPAND